MALAVVVAAAGTCHTVLAATGPSVPLQSVGIPSERAIAATANPNLTPDLFTQDPTESAEIYAKAQAFDAANSMTCGGASAAEQGLCCPFSPSDGACDDHDPAASTCADANSTTPTESYITDASGNDIGLIETRYSPTCGTNWARITGFGQYAAAVKQATVCRGQQGQYSDSGCSDTDTGVESTRFSDQLYAPTECAFAVGVLVMAGTSGAAPAEFTATTPTAC